MHYVIQLRAQTQLVDPSTAGQEFDSFDDPYDWGERRHTIKLDTQEELNAVLDLLLRLKPIDGRMLRSIPSTLALCDLTLSGEDEALLKKCAFPKEWGRDWRFIFPLIRCEKVEPI